MLQTYAGVGAFVLACKQNSGHDASCTLVAVKNIPSQYFVNWLAAMPVRWSKPPSEHGIGGGS